MPIRHSGNPRHYCYRTAAGGSSTSSDGQFPGLAARVDVAGQVDYPPTHRGDDAGVIVRDDVQYVNMLESSLHVGGRSGKAMDHIRRGAADKA